MAARSIGYQMRSPGQMLHCYEQPGAPDVWPTPTAASGASGPLPQPCCRSIKTNNNSCSGKSQPPRREGGPRKRQGRGRRPTLPAWTSSLDAGAVDVGRRVHGRRVPAHNGVRITDGDGVLLVGGRGVCLAAVGGRTWRRQAVAGQCQGPVGGRRERVWALGTGVAPAR